MRERESGRARDCERDGEEEGGRGIERERVERLVKSYTVSVLSIP